MVTNTSVPRLSLVYQRRWVLTLRQTTSRAKKIEMRSSSRGQARVRRRFVVIAAWEAGFFNNHVEDDRHQGRHVQAPETLDKLQERSNASGAHADRESVTHDTHKERERAKCVSRVLADT